MSYDYWSKARIQYILQKIKDKIPFVSKDSNNAIKKGTDGGLFVDVEATGISEWADVKNKPFETLDAETLDVENGKLKVIGGGGSGAIDDIKVNGSSLPITDKSVDISVPTKTSDLTNDGDGTKPFLTEHQSLNGYATESWVGQQKYATETFVTNKGYDTVTSVDAKVKTVDDKVVALDKKADGKQDALTQGDNITIANNIISATNTDEWSDIKNKPFESIDTETLRVDENVLGVRTDNFASYDDLAEIKVDFDTLDKSVPDYVPYTNEEIYELVWDDVHFEDKPEYTTAELDAILDQIDFSGANGEMLEETFLAIWNEVFNE